MNIFRFKYFTINRDARGKRINVAFPYVIREIAVVAKNAKLAKKHLEDTHEATQIELLEEK